MSLRRIEYDDFVVEKKQFPDLDLYWSISIHPHKKHLFSQRYSEEFTSDGSQPGWMSALKFQTAEEAVEFGWTLAPIVEAASIANSSKNVAFNAMIKAAHERMTQ